MQGAEIGFFNLEGEIKKKHNNISHFPEKVCGWVYEWFRTWKAIGGTRGLLDDSIFQKMTKMQCCQGAGLWQEEEKSYTGLTLIECSISLMYSFSIVCKTVNS